MQPQQQKLQSLGLFGIYKEACKLIFSWGKIFSQITLALILPPSFIFLAEVGVSHYLITKILLNRISLGETQMGGPTHNSISKSLSSEWTALLLSKTTYLIITFVFSLLSTSSIVSSIARIYTGREVTFKKAMIVVPKVWKRYAVTFVVVYVTVLIYTAIACITLILLAVLMRSSHSYIRALILLTVMVIYLVGLVYMRVIWELATTVSVLENASGVKAMMKSADLMKGNRGVAVVIYLKITFAYAVIEVAFRRLVLRGVSLGMASRIVYGIVCFVLLFMLLLFSHVLQTVIYLVCKSYHNEDINSLAIWDQLEDDMMESVPLKGKDNLQDHSDV